MLIDMVINGDKMMKILILLLLSSLSIFADNDKVKYFMTYSHDTYEKYNGYSRFYDEIGKDALISSWDYVLPTKLPLDCYYKVYYENSKLTKAEKISVYGYFIDGKKIYKEKNSTKKNRGIVYKFDDKGREIYDYNIDNSRICNTSYAQQYIEKHCFITDETKKNRIKKEFANYPSDYIEKRYFVNNILKIVLLYEYNKFVGYTIYDKDKKSYENALRYDKNGKYTDGKLESLDDLYQRFNDKESRKKFIKAIKKRKEEIKDISDLNLTFVHQYIEKIDKLNERGIK